MKRYLHSTRNKRRRGVTAIYTMVVLLVLIGFATLTVDIGYTYNLTTNMQNNADAAALAGASALKESLCDSYEERALAVVAQNQADQGSFAPDDQIIEVGRWDKLTQTFTAIPLEDANSANAVRVVAMRVDAPLFFASIIGRYTTNVSREAVAMVVPSCNGLWGINSVDVPGSVYIDSFDATEGAYSAASAEANGDVCSNGDITVSGSADVNGDALSATGSVTIIGGAATVTGVTEEVIDPITAPAIDFGDIATNNDNATIGLTDAGTDPLDNSQVSEPGSWDLRLNNSESLTLAPGTYYLDDIEMTGTSSLILTGPTTIYLEDDIEMEGTTVINTTQNSADLTIICDGDWDGSTIKLTGNSEFYGAIVAPHSTIKLAGNANYYGTVIGATIEFQGNFSFHVDESLDLVNALKGPVMLVR